MLFRVVLIILAVLFFSVFAYAGWLDDAVQNAVENKGTQAVDEGADAIYDGVKNSGAKQESSAPAPNTPATPKNKTAKNKSATTSSTAPEANNNSTLNEAAYDKFDFIPGDKVILMDDFSDTDVGEFPRKWSYDGPDGGGNPVAVVKFAGQNYLRSVPPEQEGGYTDVSSLYILLNKKGDMPPKFTIEYDAVLGEDAIGESNGTNTYTLLMLNGDENLDAENNSKISISGREIISAHNNLAINKHDNKVHHVSISVNGKFVKAYVDNIRVVNDPNGVNRPIKYIGMRLSTGGNTSLTKNLIFSNFRLAEGGKDIKSALSTEGRIVTHGILFAPGSDKIKPESTATLKMILGLLNDDPNLKFSIEGHTDNQGSSATSQPLSEKRAAAVKNWLVSKGISADRLQTKGWGESKPIDSNATAEGKANNRRVEFVKI